MSGSSTGLFGITCLPGLTQIELSGSGRGQSPAVVLGPFAHVATRQLSANARPRRYDRIGSGKTLSVFPASPLQSGPAAFGQLQSRWRAPLNGWVGWISAGPLPGDGCIGADIVAGPTFEPSRKVGISTCRKSGELAFAASGRYRSQLKLMLVTRSSEPATYEAEDESACISRLDAVIPNNIKIFDSREFCIYLQGT